jgi:uncharacterized protein (DUF2249 family)
MIVLDNRGLMPPAPMVRILTALEQAAPGQRVQAINDREPHFLFPELAARGFAWTMERRPDGAVVLTMWAKAGATTGAEG